MLKNPEEWKTYHQQYREAREKWDVIPYQECIDRIKRMSPYLVIADFGCGEAQISDAFPGRVKSFDHVAINSKVESCNITEGVIPLKDSSIDIAVFSLSLMNKKPDWLNMLKEADRCLAHGGRMIIAEHTNQLNNRLEGLQDTLEEMGYNIAKNDKLGQFTFIEATKET